LALGSASCEVASGFCCPSSGSDSDFASAGWALAFSLAMREDRKSFSDIGLFSTGALTSPELDAASSDIDFRFRRILRPGDCDLFNASIINLVLDDNPFGLRN